MLASQQFNLEEADAIVLFRMFDTNGDGLLDRSEMEALLSRQIESQNTGYAHLTSVPRCKECKMYIWGRFRLLHGLSRFGFERHEAQTVRGGRHRAAPAPFGDARLARNTHRTRRVRRFGCLMAVGSVVA